MTFKFNVEVVVDRISGKFAPKGDIEERIHEALEEALNSLMISDVGADGDSEYEVTDYSIDIILVH